MRGAAAAAGGGGGGGGGLVPSEDPRRLRDGVEITQRRRSSDAACVKKIASMRTRERGKEGRDH